MSTQRPTYGELKAAYRRGDNLMDLLRQAGVGDEEAILLAYDLQTGSYIEAVKEADLGRRHAMYVDEVAQLLGELSPQTMLDAGTGECTTLAAVLGKMPSRPQRTLAFDISWSRVDMGREWLGRHGLDDVTLFTATLEHIPLADNSVDVLFTTHAVEPNSGREESILRELARVARRKVCLFEPSWELAGSEARARMERLGYCRSLPTVAEGLGLTLREHRLLRSSVNPLNPTAVLVLDVPDGRPWAEPQFACPACARPLREDAGALFCADDGTVFPILKGIPCLTPDSGILAGRFSATPGPQ